MAVAVALAQRNVEHGGGPFGAVVFDGDRLVAGGVNLVVASGLSIAHAEIVALSRAQQRLAFDVTEPEVEREEADLTLYTSAEPCCQCFGAIFWSGVSRLVCAATKEDVEAIGFDEGPKPDQWTSHLAKRGITTTEGVLRNEAARVLQKYADQGGHIYGRRV
jgi:tRNA(Arg) A34 adenosine deaminase TadA